MMEKVWRGLLARKSKTRNISTQDIVIACVRYIGSVRYVVSFSFTHHFAKVNLAIKRVGSIGRGESSLVIFRPGSHHPGLERPSPHAQNQLNLRTSIVA